MDIFDKDLIDFWMALNKNKVEYIMIGGVATNLHGYQRLTVDIDVWIRDTKENRQRFRLAMKEYSSIDYFMMEDLQIIPGWTNFSLNNGVKLDLMTQVKGLEEDLPFEECLKAASIADINGIAVPFLHINHLISSKKAANRPKDQLDIQYLEKIKKIQEEEQSKSS
jgi:hypothetical protein